MDDLLPWLIIAFLLAAMAYTVLFAPRKSLHGYGSLSPGAGGFVLTAK